MSTTEKGEIADLTAEELVAEIEFTDEEIRKAQKTVDYWKAQRTALEAYLSRALSPETGEVILAPSGRRVFSEWATDGPARVNPVALEEHHHQLPSELRPRYVTHYPGVTDIRKAAKEGRLPKGVTLSDLLIDAPKAKKVRWRSPETQEAR